MVDGDKPTMGYISKVMDLAKEAIKEDIRMRRPSIYFFRILLMRVGIGSWIPIYTPHGTF